MDWLEGKPRLRSFRRSPGADGESDRTGGVLRSRPRRARYSSPRLPAGESSSSILGGQARQVRAAEITVHERQRSQPGEESPPPNTAEAFAEQPQIPPASDPIFDVIPRRARVDQADRELSLSGMH